jgi:quercetin dioxygenase-like cupin family protein
MVRQVRSRVGVLLAILTTAIVAMLASGQSPITAAAQSRFVGGDPTRPDSDDMRALRLRFEAGARSNWHSHAGWQIIAAEEGRGRTQVRGEGIVELVPGGSPNYTGPGVVHWHGAAPDEHVVQLTFMGGASGADWFEPVSDDDYQGQ